MNYRKKYFIFFLSLFFISFPFLFLFFLSLFFETELPYAVLAVLEIFM